MVAINQRKNIIKVTKSMKQLFEKYQTDKTKYSKFYSFWLAQKDFKNILEIGAYKGASLRAWRDRFPSADVVGIESDPMLRALSPDLNIFVGDQTNTSFLESVSQSIPQRDLIIDDGGHKMSQQITSFRYLFPKLAPGGYYIIEDLETSYLSNWIDQDLTTTEFLKLLVDNVNFNGKSHAGENGIADIESRGETPNEYSKTIDFMVFANNICLIAKK